MADHLQTPSSPAPTAQAPAPADSTAPDSAAPKKGSSDGFKETLESIVIALILAFVFRAFIVEAFVIPTGSMAPTLMGAHMRFTCDDCGYQFDVGYNASTVDDELNIPSHALVSVDGRIMPRVYALYCPNCGYKVPRNKPADPDNDATGPAVHYGDRILVLKYAYLLQSPRRWDVVVFKSPAPNDARNDAYQTNFIKRLIGLPGESVMILDGDIYISPDGKNWTIQTKTPAAQQALWRIVYNNDFYPQGLRRDENPGQWQQPWQPVSNDDTWQLGNAPRNGRVFHFDGLQSSGAIRFNADANPRAYALTDWVAYDATTEQSRAVDMYLRNPPMPISTNVSDVKLDLWYTRHQGDGPLHLSLTKLDDEFTAEVLPDRVRLLHTAKGAASTQTLLAEAVLPLNDHLPHHLVFTNVDYHISLQVDGRVLLQTTPQQYHPDLPRLLEDYHDQQGHPRPTIQISAADQKASLSHISLWRDIYYLNRPTGTDDSWASPDKIIHLNPGEYFVLGDNSAVSLDARYWNVPINLPQEKLMVESGRVPERFMLGRAFFVYWPSGFRLSDATPAIIPNFGEMRFIR